jgi:hypothetical protein
MSHASITNGDGRPSRREIAQLWREVEGEMWEIEYRLRALEEGMRISPGETRAMLNRRRELRLAYETLRAM